jgi:DGQHR domain-containing protein
MTLPLTEDPRSISIPVLPIKQPIGDFFIGRIGWRDLCEITKFDVRRMLKEKRDFETYLGVQREVKLRRVEELAVYVNTLDACFPTAVILSVHGVCATYKPETGTMTLANYMDPEDPKRNVIYHAIAKVLDGQHRIEGLKLYAGEGDAFDINVCIFVDIDVAEEGYIFSTVNLAQTKVNKSLVYDLFDLANSPSPQKLCHNVAVALDQTENSPFYKRIKRLGVATEGRFNETLTQATIVESLMAYLSKDPMKDRDIYLHGKTPPRAGAEESQTLIFRNMMIDKRDLEIVDIIWNYFDAARLRWPTAWSAMGRGQILNKTNGFRALMRFLKSAYLHLVGPGEVPKREQFKKIFDRIELGDDEFNSDTFKPGTSGEVALYRMLKEKSGI